MCVLRQLILIIGVSLVRKVESGESVARLSTLGRGIVRVQRHFLLHAVYSLFHFVQFLHYLGNAIGWYIDEMVHWTAQKESGRGSASTADPFITCPTEGLSSDNV